MKYNIEWLKKEQESGTPLKFLYFWGHTIKNPNEIGNACFSQWHESSFSVDGIIYKTSEHWMMAQKALLFNDAEMFAKIINSEKPGEAKELGRQVSGFNDMVWNDKRYEIVKEGNINKFSQNKELGEYLLQTGNRILVETSPVDLIWGIGLTKESEHIANLSAWRGLNLLGFALMEARDFLRDMKK